MSNDTLMQPRSKGYMFKSYLKKANNNDKTFTKKMTWDLRNLGEDSIYN